MQISSRQFENTLRTHRKRSGLNQREVAYLLGWDTEAQLSRYERRRILPRLETALACQAVLGAPISELFPGPYETVAAAVKRRARKLASELQTNSGKCDERLISISCSGWSTTAHLEISKPIPPMRRLRHEKRIVAMDVRASKFGFVVLEGPDRLLDKILEFAAAQISILQPVWLSP